MVRAGQIALAFSAISCLTVSAADQASVARAIARSEQLILVTASDWHNNHGTLRLFERAADHGWRHASADLPVMLGRNGLAWGVGLHHESATKREGDGRSPAGVFELARVYGRNASAASLHFPYQQLSDVMEGIDDSRSRFYNRLVDPAQIPEQERDWTHSEKVRAANPMFRWCVEVKHNWQQRPEFGSCIYLHTWKSSSVATSGCTAMAEAALQQLVRWLDARKHPLLVQLPAREYEDLKLQWALP